MTDQQPAGAWGAGLATLDADDRVLDTLFPAPRLGSPPGDAATGTAELHAHDVRVRVRAQVGRRAGVRDPVGVQPRTVHQVFGPKAARGGHDLTAFYPLELLDEPKLHPERTSILSQRLYQRVRIH